MSNPASKTFYFYAGDTESIELVLRDSEGTVLDITGSTGRLQLRERRTSSTIAIDKAATITGTEGRLVFDFTPEETTGLISDSLDAKKYAYDVELIGTDSTVTTILRGTLTVTGDVTR